MRTASDRTTQSIITLAKKSDTAMKYDRDSNEYEMVGGVKLSDRKRSKAKTTAPAMA